MSADRPGAAGAVEPARPAAPRAGNMLDYARRELETFSRRGLCAVDSLILSWMAYLRIPADADEVVAGIRGWDGVRLADLHRAEYFGDYFAGMWSEEDGLRLLAAAAASPRLRDVRVVGHVESTDVRAEKQFAAVTFRLTDDLSYVAFRGTDSTLVGWKEDFNLSFRCPVPSQVAAARYLADVAGRLDGELVVGGHSKGGNLAVYAAASVPADVGGRITRVFSHDGPGFLPEFLATGEFANVAPRIDKTLPQSSLVGMLLEQQEGFRVVKSNRLLIWQHDPFSWRVDGRDFVYLDDLAPDARYLDAAISAWLSSRTNEERERFIDTLYSVVEASRVRTTRELRADWRRNIPTAARAFADLDPETKDFMVDTATALLRLGVRSVPELLPGGGRGAAGRDAEDGDGAS